MINLDNKILKSFLLNVVVFLEPSQVFLDLFLKIVFKLKKKKKGKQYDIRLEDIYNVSTKFSILSMV